MSNVSKFGLLVYLDIFGFKTLLENSNDEEKKIILKKILEIWHWTKENLENANVHIYFFSDGGFLFYEVTEKENKEKIQQILTKCVDDLMRLSQVYLEHKFFIRGAISVGDVFINNNLVIGLPVNRSVKYETEYCPHPLIIFPKKEFLNLNIDEEFISRYKFEKINLKNKEHMMQSLVVFPSDRNQLLSVVKNRYEDYSVNGPFNFAKYWFDASIFLEEHLI